MELVESAATMPVALSVVSLPPPSIERTFSTAFAVEIAVAPGGHDLYADRCCVVGLDGVNLCGGREIGFAGEQLRGTVIGGHADVLEDEGADQEIAVARKRIETAAEPGGACECIEAVGQINCRSYYGRAGEGAAEKADVIELVLRDLVDVLRLQADVRPGTWLPPVVLLVEFPVSEEANPLPVAARR